MTFFQYLIKNGLWYFLAFIAFVLLFVYISSYFGPLESSEVKMVVAALVVLVVGWTVGNWIAWRKVR